MGRNRAKLGRLRSKFIRDRPEVAPNPGPTSPLARGVARFGQALQRCLSNLAQALQVPGTSTIRGPSSAKIGLGSTLSGPLRPKMAEFDKCRPFRKPALSEGAQDRQHDMICASQGRGAESGKLPETPAPQVRVCSRARAHGGSEVWRMGRFGKSSETDARGQSLRSGASLPRFGRQFIPSALRSETRPVVAIPGAPRPPKSVLWVSRRSTESVGHETNTISNKYV